MKPPVGLEDFQEPVSWDQKPARPGPEPAFVGEGPVPGQGRCPSPPTAMTALLGGPTAVAQEGSPSASWRMQSKSCRPYLHCAADLSPLPSPAPLQPLAWLPQQPRSTPQGDVVTASFRPHPLLPAHPPLDPTAEQSFLKKRSPPALASGTQHHTHSCG